MDLCVVCGLSEGGGALQPGGGTSWTGWGGGVRWLGGQAAWRDGIVVTIPAGWFLHLLLNSPMYYHFFHQCFDSFKKKKKLNKSGREILWKQFTFLFA